jgi:hypothetical protein
MTGEIEIQDPDIPEFASPLGVKIPKRERKWLQFQP